MIRHWTTLLAMLAMFGFAIAGCGEEAADEEGETPTAENAPDEETADETEVEADEAEPAADEGGGGDDSTCGRAQACCEAYVGAMPSAGGVTVEQACASIGAAQQMPGGGDDTCQQLIDGWRMGFDALPDNDAPDSCAAAQ